MLATAKWVSTGTYGTHCNSLRHYYHRIHRVPSKQSLSNGTVHFHTGMDNRSYSVNVLVHIAFGIGLEHAPNYRYAMVHHCHPCIADVNYKIHTRADIRHFYIGMSRLDSCKEIRTFDFIKSCK